MIITFLLRCPQITTKENFCYIVDNPIDWKYAFNLPVLIVTYGQMSTTRPSPFPNVIPDCIDSDDDDDNDKSSWNAPFRWHWYQDNGQFEPYNDKINRILETSYERWKFHGGSSTIFLPEIYQIDYTNNRQTNMKTSYQRRVDRQLMDKSSDKKNWFYQDEQGNWIQYESLIQNSIDKAYQLYRTGQDLSSIDIQFPDRPEIYQINFLLGQQINKTTNTIKCIKYEQKCPEPVKIGEATKFIRGFFNKISKLF
jgi:hypothetical protein